MQNAIQELIEAATEVVAVIFGDPQCHPSTHGPKYVRLCRAIAAAKVCEGGWIEIKPGCKLPVQK